MKILILAQSRSGSTSLVKAIYEKSKLPFIYEPFKPINKELHDMQFYDIVNSNNLLVKIVDNNFKLTNYFKTYKDLTKHFDLVIGLTRESDTENARSKMASEMTDDWTSGINNLNIDESWFLSDRYKEILLESEQNKKEILSFDIEHFTYEGIFKRKDQLNRLESYLGFKIKLDMQ